MSEERHFRAWRLGGAASGTHDPAPARENPGSRRFRGGLKKLNVRVILAQWGAVDQFGVYSAAGLSEWQSRVAELHFDRRLEPFEIAFILGWKDSDGNWDSRRASVHLYKAKQKLRSLGG